MSNRSTNPRIRLVAGQWYAFGKSGQCGRLALVPAITFVQRLNARSLGGPRNG